MYCLSIYYSTLEGKEAGDHVARAVYAPASLLCVSDRWAAASPWSLSHVEDYVHTHIYSMYMGDITKLYRDGQRMHNSARTNWDGKFHWSMPYYCDECLTTVLTIFCALSWCNLKVHALTWSFHLLLTIICAAGCWGWFLFLQQVTPDSRRFLSACFLVSCLSLFSLPQNGSFIYKYFIFTSGVGPLYGGGHLFKSSLDWTN